MPGDRPPNFRAATPAEPTAGSPTPDGDYDVAVVGYGPVGHLVAGLLGQRGHRVAVVERHRNPYELPRAAHLDGEALRIYQQLGVAEQIHAISWPQSSYDFLNIEGALLHHVDLSGVDAGGWRKGYFFYGPDVEGLVDQRVNELDTVAIATGTTVTGLVEDGDLVRLTTETNGATETLSALHVVGADGANSFVRRAAGIGWEDLGFSADWLVVDIELEDPDEELAIPEAAQYCHPTAPVSAFRRLGRRHTRLEFPLKEGEDARAVAAPAAVWARLAPWKLDRSNAALVRHTVYTFQSKLANTFTRGRIHLVGDAAHVMPPFLGQGMCSGLRDAEALAWRLDMVLQGQAHAKLLTGYDSERRPHTREVIDASIHAGTAISLATDQAVTEALKAQPAVLPSLSTGLFAADTAGRLAPHAAAMSLQAVVGVAGRTGRLDDLTGPRWIVLARADVPDSAARRLAELDVTIFTLTTDLPRLTKLDDVEGRYAEWFKDLGAHSVVIRPDHRIYGVACTEKQLEQLTTTLREALREPGRNLGPGRVKTSHT